MTHPEILRAVGSEQQRDALREGAQARLAASVEVGPTFLTRLRHRLLSGFAKPAAAPTAPPVAADPVPASRITLVGRRWGFSAGPVVGCDARGARLAERPDGVPGRLPSVMHAVSTGGYPACGAPRVTHVLLYRLWHPRLEGACVGCALALGAADAVRLPASAGSPA